MPTKDITNPQPCAKSPSRAPSYKQQTACETLACLAFRRVLFRSEHGGTRPSAPCPASTPTAARPRDLSTPVCIRRRARASPRSEERRVGNEGASRGVAEHESKNVDSITMVGQTDTTTG